MQSGMESGTVTPVPSLRRLILAIDEDRFGIPVLEAARQIISSLEEKDALAGRCEFLGQGGAPGPLPITIRS